MRITIISIFAALFGTIIALAVTQPAHSRGGGHASAHAFSEPHFVEPHVETDARSVRTFARPITWRVPVAPHSTVMRDCDPQRDKRHCN